MDAVKLPTGWYNEIVVPGVCDMKPGIYRWQIHGAGVYIGRYTKISRPRHEYRRNVERIINGCRSHHSNGKFRCVHKALASAWRKKHRIVLTILANAEPCELNQMEKEYRHSERTNLNGRGATIDVLYTLASRSHS